MNTLLHLSLRLSSIREHQSRKRTPLGANKPVIQGFTLVELLVVIIIIGLLAAIAMPNLLNQAVKAKQTESKQALSLVNRAQSRYRVENNGFSNSFDQLAVGMGLVGATTATTGNFLYTLDAAADPQTKATITANPPDAALRSYTGGNLRYVVSGQTALAAMVCESIAPGSASLTTVTFNPTSIDCPSNYRQLDDTASGN